ncbi:hypothetical protein LCGC14_2156740 [marine sediment metagenome]|uniref:Uncharacterized protein n=1 Tax=marine sediment metagenome TaxID=412755 RepID=A0A0F9EG89_9ZZZZ
MEIEVKVLQTVNDMLKLEFEGSEISLIQIGELYGIMYESDSSMTELKFWNTYEEAEKVFMNSIERT